MSNVFTRFVRSNSKNLVIVSAFMVAMASAVGLGLATKQFGSAAGVRDSGTNPILNQGSTGCLTLSECVSDIKANKPGDVQTIYDNRGLSRSEYDRFAKTARLGKVYKDGRIVVDGQVVATGAWSMGRNTFPSQRDPLYINGKKYYKSPATSSFRSNSIDAFVMFNSQGTVEFAMLTACGNPAWGNNVKPEYGCKMLNKTAVKNKKDTYSFTTSLDPMKLATVNKVVYDFGDGTPVVTKTNPTEAVQHTYTKPGTFTAKVTVYFSIPGKQVVASTSVKCTAKVVVEAPPKPFYACDLLTPTVLNNEKTKFRFTVKTSQGNGAVLESADFVLDSSSTVTGVTTKDASGNIYREYEFARDGKEHTVMVKVNFNLAKGVTSVKCKATVKAGETPMCPIPGKEQYPVGAPECKEDEIEKCPIPGKEHLPKDSPECVEEEEKCPIPGKEHLPKDSDECEETPPPQTPPAELPKTGMGSVLGIFAGTSAIGAIGHRLIMNRRNNG